MEGMGHSQGGTSSTVVIFLAVGALMAVFALLVTLDTMSVEAADANETELPDLFITEVTNLTPVYQGDYSFFNVTIKNKGTAAYLPRTSGDLEVFGYIDSETEIAGFTRVYRDIYRRGNVTINLKVRFDDLGNHTLRIVLDGSRLVDELDDDNNEATMQVEVVPSEENRQPHADGGNDRTGYLNRPLLFSARYSEDPDGDELTYTWDFGDGKTGTGMWTNHTYLFLGDYGAYLRVSDGEKIDIDSFTVHIVEVPPNHPPTAVITTSTTLVYAKKEFILDGRASSDPDMDPLSYEWDYDASDGVDDWVKGPLVTTKWETPGTYVVSLRVSDGQESSTATVTVTVARPLPPNLEPQASAGPDREAEVGTEVVIMGGGADPDGYIIEWEWDVDGDGEYDTYSDMNGTLVHTFDQEGLYTLSIRVTDNRGGTSTDSVIINVVKAKGKGEDSPGPAALAALAAISLAVILIGDPRKRRRWQWSKG